MVPFGGHSMPVQYSDLSVRDSHLWTRSKASLFDVSHMVQHTLEGPGAQAFLERLTPSALDALPVHGSTLSAFLLPESGGIVDDTVITRLGPQRFYFVTNAACRAKDLEYLSVNLADSDVTQKPLEHKVWEGQGLVALQGPLSAEILEPLLVDAKEPLTALHFGQSRYECVRLPDGRASSPLLLSRGGYTGEDGFEISVPGDETAAFTDALLAAGTPERLRLAGLGARDSLRLEAGMCLYGHDLDENTTPAEGALGWIVGKARRQKGASPFNGADALLPQLVLKKDGGAGVARKRVGLTSASGPPAREGAEIRDASGENRVGVVTSGCPSPSIGGNIAMGYVSQAFQKVGTEVSVVVRGKAHKATVAKMPFLPSRYWKGGQTPG